MPALTAREYLRVSHDKSGRARSITEQHDDNQRAGELHGFTLNGSSYSDVSVSASRFSRKIRGDFARLLADLEHGRFGAQLLVIWESSRGSRRVGEWATLVDLLEDAGVKVHVSTHGHTYDPANPRDRRSLMEDAVDSEYESGKASMRIARALAANAENGKPHGKAPYGYKRLYEIAPSGRRVLVGQVADPDEAPVIVELFERLRAGHSIRAIAADFEKRGIRTRAGKVFASQHLGQLAANPAYGGYRTHQPGKTGGGRMFRDPLPAEPNGSWPPLVDRATFNSVRAMLISPERNTSRPGRGKHLLSMIAVCGVCGGPLTARTKRGEWIYVCQERYCISIPEKGLDELAEAVMLGFLRRPANLRALRAAPEGELAAVGAELAAARAELASLRQAAREHRLTVATLLAVEPGLVERVGSLEKRQRELETPGELVGLVGDGDDVDERWEAAPVPARRRVARLLCSLNYLGTLKVEAQERGHGHRMDPRDRVTWDRG